MCRREDISRFWTQYEAWLSMMRPTSAGLVPASESDRRCKIVPIHGATEDLVSLLTKQWSQKMPVEAYLYLSHPDVSGRLAGWDRTQRLCVSVL